MAPESGAFPCGVIGGWLPVEAITEMIVSIMVSGVGVLVVAEIGE